MWIVNQIAEQEGVDFIKLIPELDGCSYEEIFDVNDQSISAPKNMKKAVMDLLKHNPPKNDIELFNSIYHSLAATYANACKELEGITGMTYNYIYIVGGGAKNKYLNKLVEKYTGKKVVALPIEATSLGNIKVQMKAEE